MTMLVLWEKLLTPALNGRNWIHAWQGDNSAASGSNTYSPLGLFSLRKLTGSYSGYCIRLQDTNGAYSDIGFVDGVLDGNSAQTAMDAGKTRVSIWYDQSGSANHLVESRFSNMPVLVRDGLPSHQPVLRFSGSQLNNYGTKLQYLWAYGGYMAMGMRWNSGTGLNKLLFNYSVSDALYTFTMPTGASAYKALEVIYDARRNKLPPIVKLDTVQTTVNTVQYGGGTHTISGSPFVLGGSGFDGDIWEVYLYKNFQYSTTSPQAPS